MQIFNKIKSVFAREEKAGALESLFEDGSNGSENSIVYGITTGQPTKIQPRTAYFLNERNADLGNATNKISQVVSTIRKGLLFPETKELVFDHPLVELINNPGGDTTGRQFWREGSESFLLTNEFWIVARGIVTREPKELVFIRPYDLNITMDSTTGYPSTIQTMSDKDRRVYEASRDGNRIRYIDKLGLNELFPVRGAISLDDEWRGRSTVNKIIYDIGTGTDGKRANLSLLKNGMRTSAILSPSTKGSGTTGTTRTWSQKSVDAIQSNMRAFNQGSGNSGNIAILSEPADVQGLQQTNKDMDFLNLLSTSKNTIYDSYNIPLPLVSPDNMTYDNYTSANRYFYSKAVFPVYEAIADGIMKSLGPRFGLDQTVELSYSDITIKDLQPVLVEDMRKLKEAEVNKVNEIRRVGGFDDIDNGDVVLVSSNKVTLDVVAGPVFEPMNNDDSFDDNSVNNAKTEDDGEDIEVAEEETTE